MSDTRDTRRKVRWDDKRSGSSRASTVGGSSTTSSGYSGTAYPDPYADQRYNIGALEESLRATVSELDDWKNKALEHQKEQKETKARVTALEHANARLEDDKKDLQREVRSLKKELDSLRDDRKDGTKDLEREIKSLGKEIESLREDKRELKERNARLQKKIDKLDSRSEPSSPDSSKPRRSSSDGKRSKEAEQNARLKERLNKHSGDSSNSETGPSKPPSSSRMPHRSRRTSTSGERPYVEQWGPGAASTMPVSPNTSIRRPDNYITTPFSGATPSSSIPRSVRPSVDISYTASPYREDGNYHPYPLPPNP